MQYSIRSDRIRTCTLFGVSDARKISSGAGLRVLRAILSGASGSTTIVSPDSAMKKARPYGEAAQPGVRLATMHRLKGLEFSRVLIAGVQDGFVPLRMPDGYLDQGSMQQHELKERCLLYVAMTRARDELAICGFGASSPFLSS